MAGSGTWVILAAAGAILALAASAMIMMLFVRTADAWILVMGFMMLLMLANVALVIGAVVHVLTRDDLTGTERLIWVVLVVFVVPMVAAAAIAYFVLGRERTRELFRDVGAQPAAPPGP